MKYFVVLLFVSLLGDLNFFQQATMKTCEVSVIMIKHALILTAYKDIDFLKELCKVYACYFSVYVHIDKKSEIPKLDLEYLNSIENVTAISRYKINWGSYLHIQAYIDLLELAKLDDIQYVHILSANTILARRPDKLFDFFEKHPKDIFMEVLYDDGNNFSQFGYRYYGFFFEHIYNTRGKFSKVLSRVEKLCGGIQAKIKLRRNVKFEWKGYIYCHMPMGAVRYVLSYCAENPHYLKELKYCYVGEEFFFQNIIMNSEWKSKVYNNHLIFDIWGTDRGNPAELIIDDFDAIMKKEVFFARKLSAKNRDLWEKIRYIEGF